MKFNKNAVPDEVMRTYSYADRMEWSFAGEYIILKIEFRERELSDERVEGEGWLPGLVLVRHEVLRGD